VPKKLRQIKVHGKDLANQQKVEHVKDSSFLVTGGEEKPYTVNYSEVTCTCKSHQYGQARCKHWWAVEFFLASVSSSTTTAPANVDPPEKDDSDGSPSGSESSEDEKENDRSLNDEDDIIDLTLPQAPATPFHQRPYFPDFDPDVTGTGRRSPTKPIRSEVLLSFLVSWSQGKCGS
jgi:hypothetical protein